FSPGRGRGRLDLNRGKMGQELQLLRKTKNRPRQSARPGAERRVTLLRIRTAIMAVVHIENAFVRDTSPDVVSIAAFAVINIVARRRRGMFQQPLQQRNLLVALAP